MTAKCRGCGKDIVWGVLANGIRVPLDPRPPVYRTGTLRGDGTVNIARDTEALVTHFATCSEANAFSGKRRNKGG